MSRNSHNNCTIEYDHESMESEEKGEIHTDNDIIRDENKEIIKETASKSVIKVEAGIVEIENEEE